MKPNTPFPVPVPNKQAEELKKILKRDSDAKRKGTK